MQCWPVVVHNGNNICVYHHFLRYLYIYILYPDLSCLSTLHIIYYWYDNLKSHDELHDYLHISLVTAFSSPGDGKSAGGGV